MAFMTQKPLSVFKHFVALLTCPLTFQFKAFEAKVLFSILYNTKKRISKYFKEYPLENNFGIKRKFKL